MLRYVARRRIKLDESLADKTAQLIRLPKGQLHSADEWYTIIQLYWEPSWYTTNIVMINTEKYGWVQYNQEEWEFSTDTHPILYRRTKNMGSGQTANGVFSMQKYETTMGWLNNPDQVRSIGLEILTALRSTSQLFTLYYNKPDTQNEYCKMSLLEWVKEQEESPINPPFTSFYCDWICK